MRSFARLVRLTHRLQRNLLIVREGEEPPDRKDRRIDLWWGGERENASLALALGYLLQESPEWHRASLSIKTIVASYPDREPALRRLSAVIEKGRLKADIDVLVRDVGGDTFDLIRTASADADLVFLGIRPPAADEELDEYTRYYSGLLGRTAGLPATVLTLAAEDIEFKRIFA